MSIAYPSTLSIHPLPGTESFMHGFYGLEACSLRGIVRIINDSRGYLKVQNLRIKFVGKLYCNYPERIDIYDSVSRERQLLIPLEATLLVEESLPPETRLELPFELELYDADVPSDLLRTAIRLSNLMPPSSHLLGRVLSSPMAPPFEARVVYTLYAEYTEPTTPFSFAAFPRLKSCAVNVDPFVVYDPRQIPMLIQPDARRWRSAPGDSPAEYEIEISSTTLGPNDVFRFSYRSAVSARDAALGVRLLRVVLVLREHRTLGCVSGKMVKGSVDICRWDWEGERRRRGSLQPTAGRSGALQGIADGGDDGNEDALEMMQGLSRKLMREAGLLPPNTSGGSGSTE
ncbi:hypothetical protein HDU76_001014, partial [Blyttiomyces sp. JEL0837]